MPISTVIAPGELRELTQKWRKEGKKLAFVPTMGALHAGHISLVEEARKRADIVIVSIFVNPMQFGPNEDFGSYPRMLVQDIARLEASHVDVLFAPNAADMYPEGFQTVVSNSEMSDILCGRFRPGHFSGVLTVVNKLFNLVQPNYAIFGKKDYQQFTLISKMVKDLCMDLEVIGHPTLRESDGLAMSSRNLRLSPQEREEAAQIHRAMQSVAAVHKKGEVDREKLEHQFQDELAKVPGFRFEYAEIREQGTLNAFGKTIDKPAVILVAAHLGSVRLIDNLEFG